MKTKAARLTFFVLFNLLASAPLIFADENLALIKAGTDVYSNVTVLNVSATDVYFTYPHGKSVGMANVKLKNLDSALQKHFHYNATNAALAEQKQTQANAQYHNNLLASQPVPRPPNANRPAPPTATGRAAKVLWRMDLPGALKQAQSENKPVLLNFTGSDWCPSCMRFDQEIVSTSRFADYASAKLILVKLDFPRHTLQSETLRRANEELSDRYHVDSFPTYILVNASGNELGRRGGDIEGGPDAFIADLESFSKH